MDPKPKKRIPTTQDYVISRKLDPNSNAHEDIMEQWITSLRKQPSEMAAASPLIEPEISSAPSSLNYTRPVRLPQPVPQRRNPNSVPYVESRQRGTMVQVQPRRQGQGSIDNTQQSGGHFLSKHRSVKPVALRNAELDSIEMNESFDLPRKETTNQQKNSNRKRELVAQLVQDQSRIPIPVQAPGSADNAAFLRRKIPKNPEAQSKSTKTMVPRNAGKTPEPFRRNIREPATDKRKEENPVLANTHHHHVSKDYSARRNTPSPSSLPHGQHINHLEEYSRLELFEQSNRVKPKQPPSQSDSLRSRFRGKSMDRYFIIDADRSVRLICSDDESNDEGGSVLFGRQKKRVNHLDPAHKDLKRSKSLSTPVDTDKAVFNPQQLWDDEQKTLRQEL